MDPVYRPATAQEIRRLAAALVAARLFGDTAALEAVHLAEPWRILVSSRRDVAVLGRWREPLRVLAIEALWCPLKDIPTAIGQIRTIAHRHGFTDLVSPAVAEGDIAAWERAGMRVHTLVGIWALDPLSDHRPGPPVEGLVLESPAAPDLDALLAVDAACFDPFWRYDERRLVHLGTSGRFGVARLQDRAVGYSQCSAEGMLGRLAVVPEVQGRGIGHALVDEAVRYTLRQGAPRMWLSTQVDNAAAQALYRSAGFRDTGQRHAVLRLGDEGPA